MKDFMEGLQKLALIELFGMQKDLGAIEKAIKELSDVEPSLPDTELEQSGTTYASQAIAEGGIGQQIVAHRSGNIFNSGEHVMSGKRATMNIGKKP
jgi:hypothetical protein